MARLDKKLDRNLDRAEKAREAEAAARRRAAKGETEGSANKRALPGKQERERLVRLVERRQQVGGGNDEVLGVAFQYTVGGQVYQVGEFANDGVEATASNPDTDLDEARKRIGALLHTLQDFYSHSNWIEMGKTEINHRIGIEENIGRIANIDQATCTNDGCKKIQSKCVRYELN